MDMLFSAFVWLLCVALTVACVADSPHRLLYLYTSGLDDDDGPAVTNASVTLDTNILRILPTGEETITF